MTVLLIFAGAMVKSTGSGLAVPDWPLSYGMIFPPMVGGVLYEHGHRMVAALVGIMMLCLAVWLKIAEKRRWVRRLGYWAVGAVILQGLLGGLTVLFFLPTWISVSHGILAQIFFILTIIIAYSQSQERDQRNLSHSQGNSDFLKLGTLWTMLIFVQLILGAVMRHTESGLAIPDFPKMGGYWIPPFDGIMLAHINDHHFEHNLDFVTITQVYYHFLHRLGAMILSVVFCILFVCGMSGYKQEKSIRTTLIWIGLMVALQIIFGIMTVLTVKEPWLTSIHVVTGALILGVSVLLVLRAAPLSIKDCKQEWGIP